MKLMLRDRLQVQVRLNWQLMPEPLWSWKKWAFELTYGLTLPNQVMHTAKTKGIVPENSKRGLDFDFDVIDGQWKTQIVWAHVNLRVLGLEAGAGFFWRTRKEYENDNPCKPASNQIQH